MKKVPKEHILQIFSSKYIFFRFRTLCIFFSFLKTYFGCGMGVDPAPRLRAGNYFLSLPLHNIHPSAICIYCYISRLQDSSIKKQCGNMLGWTLNHNPQASYICIMYIILGRHTKHYFKGTNTKGQTPPPASLGCLYHYFHLYTRKCPIMEEKYILVYKNTSQNKDLYQIQYQYKK